MAHTIIIGAGLTGLSAAYHLEKLGFYDYLLFEKESSPGGLCRSFSQDGFTFDYTGHLLHLSDEYARNLIDHLVGLELFNSIDRQSAIYLDGLLSGYPFQTNLYGRPTKLIAACIEGYVKRTKQKSRTQQSFVEWVYTEFGSGFAKHFFLPYQKKIFDYDLHHISAQWTGRFVPHTSLEKIIDGALHDKSSEHVGYNATFFYPRTGGIKILPETIAGHLRNPIYYSHEVTNIDLQKKVVIMNQKESITFTQIINTMPLDRFISLIRDKSSTSFYKETENLQATQVINFNLGINKPHISNHHWIYYPESRYPFYRIGFPSLLSSNMAPAHTSSLSGEIAFCNKSKNSTNYMLRKALTLAQSLFQIDKKDIITEKTIYISHGYVIYNFWREKNLTKLLHALTRESIYCAGRYAEWKYASMQEALLDGKYVAERLIIKPAFKTDIQETKEYTLSKVNKESQRPGKQKEIA